MTTTTDLDWFTTGKDVFPGCTDCCELVGSPMAHKAMDAKPIEDDDLQMLVFRATVQEYHDGGHKFKPTPLAIKPKRRQITS